MKSQTKRNNHTIKVIVPAEVYDVKNNLTGEVYQVDLMIPSCECKAFKYSKRKRGKKNCKHISLIKGIVKK